MLQRCGQHKGGSVLVVREAGHIISLRGEDKMEGVGLWGWRQEAWDHGAYIVDSLLDWL